MIDCDDRKAATRRVSFADFAREDLVPRVMAAQLLHVAPSTLAGWAVRGGGPKLTKLGRAVRYQVADLLDHIEAQKRASTTA